ncbi:NosD domain-containing protein [Inquilinus sp. CAU 1745]|uniref:NosD domain-containing protein n=1 Tax=Inquilinus sp. CAU 1745 TaxID=3140369 RepID=UPI00325A75EC
MRISRSALAGSAAAIAMLCGQPAIAEEPQGQPSWGPHIDFEGRWGGDRNLGEVDLFLPLWQDGRSLLFGDIRTRLDNQGSREGNFGIGYRRMLDNGWNLGGYGFFDLRRTDDDNLFRQATLGVEALSFDWDFRANAYLPLGDTSKSLPSTGSDPYAELQSGTIQVVTPGVTLREEQAMAGFNVEVGRRVPVFPADSGTQLRAYAGFYHFTADGAEDVTGPRLRLELTVNEVPALWPGARLTLGAELQHDDVRDTEGFLLARLRVPLYEVEDRPRLPAPVSPRTHQIRRMTDPIVRDIDIVAQTVTIGQTPEQREFAVDPRTGLPYAAVESFDAATVSEADMRAAVNSMDNSIIILNGDFAVTDPIYMADSQTLIGGGGTMPVQGETSGTIVSFTAPGQTGSVSGNLGLSAITYAGTDGALRNLTIVNHSPTGGSVNGYGNNITIADNHIVSSGRGIFFEASEHGAISGNVVRTTGDGNNGIAIYQSKGVRVSDNIVTTSGENSYGVYFFDHSDDGVVSGNRITTYSSDADGIYFENSDKGVARDNAIATAGEDADGIYFRQSNNGVASDNVITTMGDDADGINFLDSDNGAASDNAIRTSGENAEGVFISVSNSADVTGNSVVTGGANAHGIVLGMSGDGTISGNVIVTQGADSFGIELGPSYSTTIAENRIQTGVATAHGLAIIGEADDLIVRDNTFGPIGEDAISVEDDVSFVPDSSTGNIVSGTIGGATCDIDIGVFATGTVSFTDGTLCYP